MTVVRKMTKLAADATKAEQGQGASHDASHVVIGRAVLGLVDVSAVVPALCQATRGLFARLRRALAAQSADRASRSQPWTCPQCTLHNTAALPACSLCQYRRPKPSGGGGGGAIDLTLDDDEDDSGGSGGSCGTDDDATVHPPAKRARTTSGSGSGSGSGFGSGAGAGAGAGTGTAPGSGPGTGAGSSHSGLDVAWLHIYDGTGAGTGTNTGTDTDTGVAIDTALLTALREVMVLVGCDAQVAGALVLTSTFAPPTISLNSRRTGLVPVPSAGGGKKGMDGKEEKDGKKRKHAKGKEEKYGARPDSSGRACSYLDMHGYDVGVEEMVLERFGERDPRTPLWVKPCVRDHSHDHDGDGDGTGGDGDDKYVDDAALERARRGGGWHGWHCEGSPVRQLFSLLMWDVLFTDPFAVSLDEKEEQEEGTVMDTDTCTKIDYLHTGTRTDVGTDGVGTAVGMAIEVVSERDNGEGTAVAEPESEACAGIGVGVGVDMGTGIGTGTDSPPQPNIFVTPYQDAPLDLGARDAAFYWRRRCAIRTALRALCRASRTELCAAVERAVRLHFKTQCRGLSWGHRGVDVRQLQVGDGLCSTARNSTSSIANQLTSFHTPPP